MHIYNPRSNILINKIVEISQKWWSRYVLRTLFVSILPIFLAYYGTEPVHERARSLFPEATSIFDNNVFILLGIAAFLVFILTVLYGWIEHVAKESCSIADKELHTLLRVFDGVVGAKAERFGKFLRKSEAKKVSPSSIFNNITKPEEQIALLGQALHSFFESIDTDHVAIRVGVAPITNLISTDLPLSAASPQTSCQFGQLHGSAGIASQQDRSGD